MSGTPIDWTFRTWIEKFKGVDLPIGDLADDILRDASFPEEESFGVIHEYISEKAKHATIVETFVFAWSYYQASK